MTKQYSGADWMRAQKKELSPLGEKAANVLGEMFAGIYHIEKEVLKADFSDKHLIRVCLRDNDFSTYDSNVLTRLVFLCHARNIRASIRGAAHHYLWVDFVEVDWHGFFAHRHPTLSESLQRMGLSTASGDHVQS